MYATALESQSVTLTGSRARTGASRNLLMFHPNHLTRLIELGEAEAELGRHELEELVERMEVRWTKS